MKCHKCEMSFRSEWRLKKHNKVYEETLNKEDVITSITRGSVHYNFLDVNFSMKCKNYAIRVNFDTRC